jgi:hypothetical protein
LSLEKVVDEQRGAGLRVRVDMGRQEAGSGDISGKVMVDIENLVPLLEKPLQEGSVPVERDVEDGYRAIPQAFDPGKQQAVPLDSRDATGLRHRPGQSQLMQGTESVRITIEDIVMHYDKPPCLPGRTRNMPDCGCSGPAGDCSSWGSKVQIPRPSLPPIFARLKMTMKAVSVGV